MKNRKENKNWIEINKRGKREKENEEVKTKGRNANSLNQNLIGKKMNIEKNK